MKWYNKIGLGVLTDSPCYVRKRRESSLFKYGLEVLALFIDAEVYSDLYLKNKNESTVRSELTKLREEIAKIKHNCEDPFYDGDSRVFPPPYDAVAVYREYMKKASEALYALIGDDGLTEAERSARYIDGYVSDVKRVILTVGVEFQEKYVLTVGESFAALSRCVGNECENSELDIKTVSEVLAQLHFGEWKPHYSVNDYGLVGDDAFEWSISFEYRGASAPRIYSGKGVFPYNFRILGRLLAVS